MAASQAAQESVHLSRLESELGLASSTSTTPTELFVDNKSAIDVAYNPEHHGRMKHVERKHFYVRELVEQHKLRVTFVSTDDNLSGRSSFTAYNPKPFASDDTLVRFTLKPGRIQCFWLPKSCMDAQAKRTGGQNSFFSASEK